MGVEINQAEKDAQKYSHVLFSNMFIRELKPVSLLENLFKKKGFSDFSFIEFDGGVDVEIKLPCIHVPALYFYFMGEEHKTNFPDMTAVTFSRTDIPIDLPKRIMGQGYIDQQERLRNLAPMSATPDMI